MNAYSKIPFQSTRCRLFILLGAVLSISFVVLLISKSALVGWKASNNDRKLLFRAHSRPYAQIYSMLDYQSASKYTPRYPPSRSYTDFNSYYGTGKRFWRKPTTMCAYDEDDKQSLESISASMPYSSQTVRYSLCILQWQAHYSG